MVYRLSGLVNHRRYPTLFQVENDQNNNQQLLIHLNATKIVTEPGQWYFPGFTLEIANSKSEVTIFTKHVTCVFTRVSDSALNIKVYVDSELFNQNAFQSFWGNFNGDPSDDLTAPDGSKITSSASIREIQSHFRKWQLKFENESFFKYAAGESFATHAFPDWEPHYFDTSNPPAAAVAVCGDSKACLYDYQATGGNVAAAKLTASTDIKLKEEIVANNKSGQCPDIVRPANGFAKLLDDDSGDAIIGSTVRFSCYSTFKLIGAETSKCQGNSTWSNPTPECKTVLPTYASVGLIVGSVVGVVVCLALIIAAIVYL